MEGTLTLFHSSVRALFDTGASRSFIAVRVMHDLGLVPQVLETTLNAVSLLGITVKLGKVCKECPLTVQDRNFFANLVVLFMSEFDIILGMDWLTKYGAIFNCDSRTIVFSTIGQPSVKFQCNQKSDMFLTSRIVAIESTSTEVMITQIPIVQDFEDLFQAVSRLPPKRDIDFCIELAPGTLPLSKTLYRMAPTEMLELKKQVKKLETLGFVCPSTSLGEHQCCSSRRRREHFDSVLTTEN